MLVDFVVSIVSIRVSGHIGYVLIEVSVIVVIKCCQDSVETCEKNHKETGGRCWFDEGGADADDTESMLRNRPEIDSNHFTSNLDDKTQYVSQRIMT